MFTQYIQAREARANFSTILNSVANTGASYTIKIRNQPKAVLVNIADANNYQLAKLRKQKKTPSGELFSKKALEWFDKYGDKRTYKKNKLENISGNIDKILYGI